MEQISAKSIKNMINTGYYGIPFILFKPSEDTISEFLSSGYKRINLNKIISEKLMKYPQNERESQITGVVADMLTNSAEAVLIENFEILFSKRFRIDSIKAFCDASRQRKIAVVWNYEMNGNNLIYGNEEYADYKSIDLSNSNVILIK